MHFKMLFLTVAAGSLVASEVSARPAAAIAGAAPAATPSPSIFSWSAWPGPAESNAREAVNALASAVRVKSHPDALLLAFRAYYQYREENPERVRKPYLYFVDYGLDNLTPRGYVFDMEELEVVEGPFIVAHGRGSSSGKNGVPVRFSNTPGSAATSLGLYVAQETYAFTGKSGGVRYSSIGLRMAGVSGRFNSTARARGVVIHGAPYVTASGSGRSEGCPAMEQARANRLIPKLANGALVFLFSPNDQAWMGQDPWAAVNATP